MREWAMLNLTNREQKILAVVAFLLLTGLAVKTYRTAQPAKQTVEISKQSGESAQN